MFGSLAIKNILPLLWNSINVSGVLTKEIVSWRIKEGKYECADRDKARGPIVRPISTWLAQVKIPKFREDKGEQRWEQLCKFTSNDQEKLGYPSFPSDIY